MKTLENKKSIITTKQQIQAKREELLKKMIEEFSKINPDTLGKATIKTRKPLKTIEIGKVYSFPYNKGAKNKGSILSYVEIYKIKNLKDYYQAIAKDGEYTSYDDYSDDEEDEILKLNTTCLVCDIILKQVSYSTLHKKILCNEKYNDDDEVVVMIDNKFYSISSGDFKNFAKELVEKDSK